ncbi:hypothetical protein KKF61_02305 [Patescibacteria group bacterium]|nr:hypothetical protein [Patescibacteria group bacterium]MBU0963859.1 hypothetical protein [Patescibacteria group bacterium]
MEKKNYSALFAVIMALMLIPYAPAFIEDQFNKEGNPEHELIPATHAATSKKSVMDYISTGYIGNYGLTSLPQVDARPQVLGITDERVADSPYQAKEVDRSNAVVNLEPGQAVTVWVDFLNTGQATWRNTGNNYVAVNASGPAGRDSLFRHEFWKEHPYRPARLLQSEVRPGEIGRFRFALQAPSATGIYTEKFNLVAENLTWIDGGHFEFLIGVGETINRPPDYQAEQVERSHGGQLSAEPGQAFTFWVDFKNTGLKSWYNDSDHFLAVNVSGPTGRVSSFKHDYWNEYYYRPTRLLQSRVYPGENGRFRFALQAPNVAGYYTEKFALVAENLNFVPGGEFTINIKVGDPPVIQQNNIIENEPAVRIGLLETTEQVTITANGGYDITNMNTEQKTIKEKNEVTAINVTEDAYWRLTPHASSTIMEITSWNNAPLWNPNLNDNKFRGTIEIRYLEATESLWVINELGVESYLKGLAEVANEQPEEYLKALITGARSYVLWHKLHGGKHPDKFFDINANTDQVYKGYGFEERSEDPLAAVLATTGTVITHSDAVSQINPQGIAMAAYSSGTDGRTRNWTEVWAGSGYPWLVAVDDPYGAIPNYNTLHGNHMVGMSAQGARGYATEKNKTYDWILKHYYTGVDVEKIY